jgi:hypothetical protein
VTKEALQSFGKEAAESYLKDDTPLNESIRKIASDQSLTDQQIERVAHYANRSVNAELMKESAYTEFEMAEPEEILRSKEAAEKTAGFAPRPAGGHEKTAAPQSDAVVNGGLFSKIAGVYGAEYVPSPSPKRDARHLLGAAEKIAHQAADQLKGRIVKLSQKREEVYEEIKNSIYEGASPKEALRSMKEEGHGKDVIEYVLNRLEADSMIPRSEYPDDGPYSLERHYLKEGSPTTIAEEAPLRKKAAELKKLADNASLDAAALRLASKVAANAGALSGADFDVHPGLAEKQAGIMSSIGSKGVDFMKGLGEAAKSTIRGAESVGEGVGNFVAEKPFLRTIELGFGGYSAGQLAGKQEEDMEKQKRQF